MTPALFFEALLLGQGWKKWTSFPVNGLRYNRRLLTNDEYNFLVNDLNATIPLLTTVNSIGDEIELAIEVDGQTNSAYIRARDITL